MLICGLRNIKDFLITQEQTPANSICKNKKTSSEENKGVSTYESDNAIDYKFNKLRLPQRLNLSLDFKY